MLHNSKNIQNQCNFLYIAHNIYKLTLRSKVNLTYLLYFETINEIYIYLYINKHQYS